MNKLTGKYVPEQNTGQHDHSSYSSVKQSQSYSGSQEREVPSKTVKNEYQQKTSSNIQTLKTVHSSQAHNAPSNGKQITLRIEKSEPSAPIPSAKDDQEHKGTGLFSKPSQKKQIKPKIILTRSEIVEEPPISRPQQLTANAKRSTPAFEIYEYPVSNPIVETRERQEGGSLLQRITKKESKNGNSASLDIRSRIIKNPLKY